MAALVHEDIGLSEKDKEDLREVIDETGDMIYNVLMRWAVLTYHKMNGLERTECCEECLEDEMMYYIEWYQVANRVLVFGLHEDQIPIDATTP